MVSPTPEKIGQMNAGSDVIPLIRCYENIGPKMLLFLFVNALKIQIEQEDHIKRGLMFMKLKRVKIKLKSLQPTLYAAVLE